MTSSTPYSSTFFDAHSRESEESAKRVLGRLFELFRPRSMVDIGCGVGAWLAVARALGVPDILGVDGSYVPRDRLRIPLEHFREHDLSQALDLGRRFDLVVSVEVAEHLPPEAASDFVRSLTQHGDLILFSAAVPYQGGTDHRNENWLEFWAALFAEQSYEPIDLLRPVIWHDPNIAWWYRQNTVLFRARGSADRILPTYPPTNAQSLIHPELLLRSVRREPQAPFKSDVAEDIAYYKSLSEQGPIPKVRGYGPEFDYKAPLTQVDAYEDLEAHAAAIDSAVLRDALAPIKPRQPPLEALTDPKTPPDFLCIGVQKAATTWLYELARTHRQMWPGPIKELNFFNQRAFEPGSAYHNGAQRRLNAMIRAYARNTKTLDPSRLRLLVHLYQARLDGAWYEEIFRFYPNKTKLRGEFTPDYVMLPDSGIAELKKFAPNVRLILMLREPVDRVVSHLGMIAQQAPAAAPFLDLLAREASVLARSRYELLLPRWRAHFDEEQLLIVSQPETRERPLATAARVARFLGIAIDGFDARVAEKRIFPGKAKPNLSADTLAFLEAELSDARRIFDESFARA